MATFIVDCPRCQAKVAAELAGIVEASGFDDNAMEPYANKLAVGKCPRCGTMLAATSQQTHFGGYEGDEYDAWSDPVRVYPNPRRSFSSSRIPRTVKVSLAEADIALQGNANLAACVMFGRALEALCRDVLFSDEEKKAVRDGTSKKRLMLGDGISQLRKVGLIDDRLFDWSQHLHAFRNLAAHPDMEGTSISREDAEDLQAFVYAITEYIYDLADRYEEFKRRQTRRAEARAKPQTLGSLLEDDG